MKNLTLTNDIKRKLKEAKYLYDKYVGVQHAYIKEINGRKIHIKVHIYTLNHCLSEREIESIERENGIELPEEYRLFIHLIGDGNKILINSLKDSIQEAKNKGILMDDLDGFIVLDENWPNRTLLAIHGQHRGQVFSSYDGTEDGIAPMQILNQSFLSWLDKKLHYKIIDLQEKEKQHQRNNNDKTIKGVISRLDNLAPSNPLITRIKLIKEVKKLAAAHILSPEEYCNLLDYFFIRDQSKMTAFIGQHAIDHFAHEDIDISKNELIKILQYTGVSYMNLKNEKAISILLKIIDISNDSFHHSNIAKILFETGQFELALSHIEKAPETFYSLPIKGLIYKALGNREEAKKIFEAAIKKDPSPKNHPNIQLYLHLGNLFREERNYDQAEMNYLFIINQGAKSWQVYYKLVSLYIIQGKFKKAWMILYKM